MKCILYDSNEAAHKVSAEVWEDSNGTIHISEDAARYSGCTHRKCARCSIEIVPKSLYFCSDCIVEINRDLWEHLPKADWDGHSPIMLLDEDDYVFTSTHALAEYCHKHGVSSSDLFLVHTRPLPIASVDIDNIFLYDYAPQGISIKDLPFYVTEAIDKLNNAIEKFGSLGVQTTDIACVISDEQKNKIDELIGDMI